MTPHVARLTLVLSFVLVAATVPVAACPLCEGTGITLAEQISISDATVLVKWLGGKPAKPSDAGSTEFEVVDVFHQQAAAKLQKGQKLNLIGYRPSKVGDLFLLIGNIGVGTIEWGGPLEISQAAYDYLKNAPKADSSKRLSYYLKHLENADTMIGDDAYREFANAPYQDVVALRQEFPREKLRTWLTSRSTSPGRIGLFGLMLGLCGTEDDIKLLERKILEPTDELRLGIDGVMGGYLLLAGEKGLATLETKKLADKKAPFSETYSAMQAIRFMWQYGDNKFDHDRLRQSMRILLDRPELADLVIADLARMKDWSVQDKLMVLFDDEAYSIPSLKRAIVRYTLAAAKDLPKKDGATGSIDGGSDNLPAHVLKAQKCLEEFERRDPRTVQEAKRYYTIK